MNASFYVDISFSIHPYVYTQHTQYFKYKKKRRKKGYHGINSDHPKMKETHQTIYNLYIHKKPFTCVM